MASVQERLQISRMPLDKWSTREQLCLASAVSCSGDQNWMSVSRTLKIICGNNCSNRPADWFSQKNCAVQYGHLLENVETPKRKKRSSEGSGISTALPTIETPTSDDLILRRLTEERVRELKAEIRKEQEEYAKVLDELKLLQWGKLSDDQIIEMWREIEKQQEAQRIEEMKLENQMREREQRKAEMQRSWRPTAVPVEAPKTETNTNAVDMDVEEIITSTKPVMSGKGTTASTQSQSSQSAETSLSIPPRSAAPTITTLLTSGSIPSSNQPIITLTSFIPANEAEHLLTRPISGLPNDGNPTVLATPQSVLSPSRSAPTLSMLLEKTKTAVTSSRNQEASAEAKGSENNVTQKTESKANRSDSINEEVPMDIEEDVPPTNTANAKVSQNLDLDEPDPNEEQQLLEVFKNIGNIDDMDVGIDVSDVIDDEAVDFLKGVDDEAANDVTEQLQADTKFDSEELIEESKPMKTSSRGAAKDEESDNKMEIKANEEDAKLGVEKVKRDASSDDSNDDIPLAAVASLESKERGNFLEISQETPFLKGKVESAIKSDDIETKSVDSPKIEITGFDIEIAKERDIADDDVEDDTKAIFLSPDSESRSGDTNGKSKETNSDFTSVSTKEVEISEVKKLIQVDKPKGEAVGSKSVDDISIDSKASNEGVVSEIQASEQPEEISTADDDAKVTPPPIVAISIADTDEDSSTTDASISTRKDDKTASINKQAAMKRKSFHDVAREEQKADDDFTTVSATPVRPNLLRKLRERDRSESPMIEDETTTSENATNLRSRQRCTSTPIIDSIPNSPASSDRDDREAKASKKSLLNIYNALQANRSASLLQSIFSDDNNIKILKCCRRAMDFQTIKKNIDSGVVRNAIELQRDVMLMCQNALMISKTNSANAKAVMNFMRDCEVIKGFISNPHASRLEREPRDRKSFGNTNVKIRSRKSQRNL